MTRLTDIQLSLILVSSLSRVSVLDAHNEFCLCPQICPFFACFPHYRFQ